MRTLSPSERRALRAEAHALHPVVIVGQHGLTPAVMKEIDVSLRAHELIKIRVVNVERAAREGALARICAELDAAPVQHLGKLLVVWRPAADPKPDPGIRNKPSTTKRPRPRAAGTSRAAGGATATTAATVTAASHRRRRRVS
jgi:putative YhbY family RNA-binding protein